METVLASQGRMVAWDFRRSLPASPLDRHITRPTFKKSWHVGRQRCSYSIQGLEDSKSLELLGKPQPASHSPRASWEQSSFHPAHLHIFKKQHWSAESGSPKWSQACGYVLMSWKSTEILVDISHDMQI